MSHRKFEAPRHGSLGFLPRKRTKKHSGKIRKFPRDDTTKPVHLTAFMGYKAGMTLVVRHVDRLGSKLHKKEVVEPVTVLECPPMVCVGVVGYVPTSNGLRALTTVWAQNLGNDFLRRMYKNWYRCKRKAFTRYSKNMAANKETFIKTEMERIVKHCTVVRIVAHTQASKLPLRQKKGDVMEIQLNGGSIEDKVKMAIDLFEKPIPLSTVFSLGELIDTIGATKGKGFEGVTTRWGTKHLPRKTHKGLRKVACIGAWHPANIQFSVARAGQNGYHHRTEVNKKIYLIANGSDPKSASTEADITPKAITPMGGFPHYGPVLNDFILIKGSCPGVTKRPITLRKSLIPQTSRVAQEEVHIRWIDTSSNFGHGRFQTDVEKARFLGPLKKTV